MGALKILRKILKFFVKIFWILKKYVYLHCDFKQRTKTKTQNSEQL